MEISKDASKNAWLRLQKEKRVSYDFQLCLCRNMKGETEIHKWVCAPASSWWVANRILVNISFSHLAYLLNNISIYVIASLLQLKSNFNFVPRGNEYLGIRPLLMLTVSCAKGLWGLKRSCKWKQLKWYLSQSVGFFACACEVLNQSPLK